jgi:hypothetical protein
MAQAGNGAIDRSVGAFAVKPPSRLQRTLPAPVHRVIGITLDKGVAVPVKRLVTA